MIKPNKKRVMISLEKSTINLLKSAAKKESRSFSNMIEVIAKNYLASIK